MKEQPIDYKQRSDEITKSLTKEQNAKLMGMIPSPLSLAGRNLSEQQLCKILVNVFERNKDKIIN